MKILVVGCGSIGRRHALNARHLGKEVVLCDIDKKRMHRFAKKEKFPVFYGDLKDAIRKSRPKAAIVATPTSMHLEHAVTLVSEGIHVMMEKPLAVSLKGIRRLETLIKKNDITFMMAHSFRFHEGLAVLKKLLERKAIGEVYHAQIMNGWYLPDWHIDEDYRKGYSAREKAGGGVLLTNMSHILDISRWLFGDIVSALGWKGRLGRLEIDVEDYASCFLKTEKGTAITALSDFLSRYPRNEIKVFGSKGHAFTAFDKNEIHLWRVSKKRFLPDDPRVRGKKKRFIRVLKDGVLYDPFPEIIKFDFQINQRYIDELRYFFNLTKKRVRKFSLDISAGKKVLELIGAFSYPKGMYEN